MENEQYIESGLSVGTTKIANKYEIFTEEEVDIINNKIPELDERVTIIEYEIEDINSSLDNMESKKADKTTINNLQGQINNLVVNGTGDSNPEVVQARGSYSLLSDRLNKNDISINAVSEEVWELQPSIKNDGYKKIDGSIGNGNYHIIIDVVEGEEYWLRCTSGWDLKPYVFLNIDTVSGYYPTQENNQIWHGYVNNILKVKIPANVTNLVVNSFDKATLEVKKYMFNKLNINSLKELPIEIVKLENLTPFLSSIFTNDYMNVNFSVEKGFMQTTGTINNTTAEYTKINVFKGDIYKITTNYGYNMVAYVHIDNNNIVEYLPSDSPSSITTKSFVYEIKKDGVLYVNTYNKSLTSIQKVVGYKIADSTINILNGKKVIFFGDSLTEGAGSWADTGTIRNKNNMTGSNFGVGGSKYTVTSSADNLNCIYNRIKAQYSTNSDADYIILSGLVNDALQSMPLGTMLSKTDFTTECDTSTVYGAYEMTIRYVLENWKGAKVGVIITPNIPSSSKLNEYFDVARNVCKKYSVPYLDLYEKSGLCVGIESIRESYYKGDDIHPNALGYEKYINNKVESFMKTL